MFQLAALAAGASKLGALAGTAKSFSGVFAGLSGGNKKDPARVALAQRSLEKALQGDASAVEWMKSQALDHPQGSATQVGKEAYRRALAEYYRQAGENAVGTNTGPLPSYENPAPPQSPVKGIIDRAVQDVRNVMGNAVSTVVTGAGADLGGRVTGDGPGANPPSAFPIDQNTMMLLAVGAAAFLMLRKR